MKRNHNRRQHRAALGLFCVFSLFASPSYAVPAAIASRTASIDGVQLHYLIAGSGPAVLLLHGYTQTSRMWGPIIPLLAEKFTVIAVDLPGIGDSSIPADNKIDMITAAKQIHDLVRSLKIEGARGGTRHRADGRDRRHSCCLERRRTLDFRRTAKGNDRRVVEIFVSASF